MKKTTIGLEPNERQMLELLSKGSSSKEMARRLGYREGTMRVYLHNLYRKLGVDNKTSAVIWYLEGARVAREAPAAAAHALPLEESFGDRAIRTNLLAALGVMSIFLGAHGRLWEVGMRLKGKPIDEAAHERRMLSRRLWEAVLAGDFALAKRLHDDERVPQLIVDSPSDGVLVAAMLLAGGYTSAADRTLAQVSRRRRGGQGATAKEFTFLQALRDSLERGGDEALACLHQIASENAQNPVLRHLAMVCLFHVRLARKDLDRARATAGAVWAEAEKVRQQLQAMGERPFGRDAGLPETVKVGRERLGAYVGKLVTAK